MTESHDTQERRRIGGIDLNLNTVLLGIVLALSGWTLNRVSTLSETMAVAVSVSNNQAHDIDLVRSRLATVEIEQQKLAVEIVRLQQSTGFERAK